MSWFEARNLDEPLPLGAVRSGLLHALEMHRDVGDFVAKRLGEAASAFCFEYGIEFDQTQRRA